VSKSVDKLVESADSQMLVFIFDMEKLLEKKEELPVSF
jgi:hypothetical protein